MKLYARGMTEKRMIRSEKMGKKTRAMIWFVSVHLLLIVPAVSSARVMSAIGFARISLDSLQSGQGFFDQALGYYRQGNFERARYFIQEAVAVAPRQVLFWKLALDVFRELGDVKAMSDALDELIRLDPDERQHYRDKAYVLAYLGSYRDALDVYKGFEKRFGRDEESALARSRIYQAMNNSAAAISELEPMFQQYPSTLGHLTFLTLAEYYTTSGRYDDALRLLDQAEERFPGHALTTLAKADVYHGQGAIDQAFVHLSAGFAGSQLDIDTRAGILYNMLERGTYTAKQLTSLASRFVETYPDDPRAYAVSGDIHVRLEEYSEAKQMYAQALERNRQLPHVWQQLLQVHFFTGDIDAVKAMGSEAAALFPREADILSVTGNAFFVSKEHVLARQYLESALNYTDPENPQALSWIYGALGGVYHALRMYAESDVAFSEALAHDSLNVFALNNYAYYLAVRKERLELAETLSARTLELQPGEATYEDTYAWVLFQMGRFEDALVWIRHAIGRSPQPSATLLEHYGDILYKNGKTREALQQWKKAISRADHNDEHVDKLAKKIHEKRFIED